MRICSTCFNPIVNVRWNGKKGIICGACYVKERNAEFKRMKDNPKRYHPKKEAQEMVWPESY